MCILNALSITFYSLLLQHCFAAIVFRCKRCERFSVSVCTCVRAHTNISCFFCAMLALRTHFYHSQRKLMINHTGSVCVYLSGRRRACACARVCVWGSLFFEILYFVLVSAHNGWTLCRRHGQRTKALKHKYFRWNLASIQMNALYLLYHNMVRRR